MLLEKHLLQDDDRKYINKDSHCAIIEEDLQIIIDSIIAVLTVLDNKLTTSFLSIFAPTKFAENMAG